jgi:hypothetical protein
MTHSRNITVTSSQISYFAMTNVWIFLCHCCKWIQICCSNCCCTPWSPSSCVFVALYVCATISDLLKLPMVTGDRKTWLLATFNWKLEAFLSIFTPISQQNVDKVSIIFSILSSKYWLHNTHNVLEKKRCGIPKHHAGFETLCFFIMFCAGLND